MNNIQRLKFAWVRGARIQMCTAGPLTGVWLDLQHAPSFFDRSEPLRIHPDDEHLQYGPLSSALRQRVLYADWNDGSVAALWAAQSMGFLREETYYAFDDIHLHFWLFLAEMLADEGL